MTELDRSQTLLTFSTCDISDALSKLSIHSYISNPKLISKSVPKNFKFIGPAHTIKFVPFSQKVSQPVQYPHGFHHHVDCAPAKSVIVITTPVVDGESIYPNAVWGGIMQTRANALGIVGVVIEGKCRDVVELDSVPNIPVFATGTSTLGASGYLKVAEVGQPVHLNVGKYGGPSREWQVVVENGDLIMADIDGVVRIPKNRVEDVLRICQDAVRRDEKCKEAVADGMTIFDAFKKFRQS